MKRISSLLAALTALMAVDEATAQTSIDARRSDAYYAVHASASGGLLLGSGLVNLWLFAEHGPAWEADWFPLDLETRENFSTRASRLSDMLFALGHAAPVYAHGGLGIDRSFSNASMPYLEAATGQLFLNSIVKHAVARPRPYVHRSDPHIVRFREGAGTDSYLSFYSGHTSLAFSSALAGSYLFSLRSPDRWARRVMWGSELALAGATATLRIVAGRHYPSDVLVGVAAGAAFGLGVPLLHGYRDVPAGFGSDVVWGLGGLGVGVLASGGAAALGAFDEDPHVDVAVTSAGGAPVATLRGRF